MHSGLIPKECFALRSRLILFFRVAITWEKNRFQGFCLIDSNIRYRKTE